jgi:hypothetical protein
MDTIQINEEGILKLLLNINPRKASGPDNIPARILRETVPNPHYDLPNLHGGR